MGRLIVWKYQGDAACYFSIIDPAAPQQTSTTYSLTASILARGRIQEATEEYGGQDTYASFPILAATYAFKRLKTTVMD